MFGDTFWPNEKLLNVRKCQCFENKPETMSMTVTVCSNFVQFGRSDDPIVFQRLGMNLLDGNQRK